MDEDTEVGNDKGLPSLVETLVDGSTVAASIAEPEEFVEDFCGEKRRLRRNPKLRHKLLCRQKAANCMKRFCVYMLSYVGLTCTVIAYSILGGVVFLELEKTNEDEIHNMAKQSVTNISTIIDTERDEAIQMEIETFTYDEIQRLENEIYDKLDYLRMNESNHQRGLVSLKNFIREQLRQTRNLYKTQRNRKRNNFKPSKNTTKLIQEFQLQTYNLVNKDGWSGDYDGSSDKWTFAGSLLYSVTVITTIGYGTITPKTDAGRVITIFYALIGIPLTVLCITNIGRAMASLFRALYGGTFCVECRQQFFQTMKNRRTDSIAMDDLELDKVEFDVDLDEKIEHNHNHAEVPIAICLILVLWYIVFGATMFKLWEDTWSIFDGAYFCFITLSTIGFGDIVPGFSHKDWDNQAKQVACSLYLLIGLSTLAMCFDLIQQRGTAIANNFGRFIGLVKDEDD